MERKTWWQLGGSFTDGFRKESYLPVAGVTENRNRNGHTQTASVLVICPLTSIINDQIFEVESMGLSTCNLSEKLADLTVRYLFYCTRWISAK